jgi:SEC-C motif
VRVSAGHVVEERVRAIAATLGVPEFVYSVPLVSKASGVREVGDGILACGGGGAILQVKARSVREGSRDTADGAERWVLKHAARAARQGAGSKRTIAALQRAGCPPTILPVRSLALEQADRESFQIRLEMDCSSWPTIVVIDHPQKPHVSIPFSDQVFCMSLTDWTQLNRHLRSIHEVLRYVESILAHGNSFNVPLEHEYDRYRSLVAYDAQYASRAKGALGAISFAAIEDPIGLGMYRQLLENTWGPNEVLPGMPIEDYRPMLDVLDDVPAVVQAYVGRWIMERRRELDMVSHRVSGSTLLGNKPLIYMCDKVSNYKNRKSWVSLLGMLTTLRAVEWREQRGRNVPVLGIGVRMGEAGDEYSYILVDRSAALPRWVRTPLEWEFGVANFNSFRTSPLKVGRNEACPCGSGRKYKQCHLWILTDIGAK